MKRCAGAFRTGTPGESSWIFLGAKEELELLSVDGGTDASLWILTVGLVLIWVKLKS